MVALDFIKILEHKNASSVLILQHINQANSMQHTSLKQGLASGIENVDMDYTQLPTYGPYFFMNIHINYEYPVVVLFITTKWTADYPKWERVVFFHHMNEMSPVTLYSVLVSRLLIVVACVVSA